MMEEIRNKLKCCIKETSWPNGKKFRGKVRDVYDEGDRLVLITTDRLSAFDRDIAVIPFKGQVLNQISVYWFEQTKDIVANHFLEMPDSNITIAKKCQVFPVEFVVRGFITGTTETSLWSQYNNGIRNYCGYNFTDGLKKNQRLKNPILTPTTKNASHDRPISLEDIVKEGLMSQAQVSKAESIAYALYQRGVEIAKQRGLILVDTKYEMGLDSAGNIILVDEVHTPDSSRYWLEESYENLFAKDQEPDNFDKEFLRKWYATNSDPYNDDILPDPPEDLVMELSSRYIKLYEMITGKIFQYS